MDYRKLSSRDKDSEVCGAAVEFEECQIEASVSAMWYIIDVSVPDSAG